MSYVTPIQDISYSNLNNITAFKIYEIVKENQDTILLLNDKGELDELHKSLIRANIPLIKRQSYITIFFFGYVLNLLRLYANQL
ncbi:hypothetical protein [Paenibacillus whitsoniae]|uniref:Uncharacterized protein n=1 Tax=Paenibacillus whitsoniae TaxID=2496558 RepID=A0A3S0A752_9BACL|nr:hypothetical protein [Paenibacillus whitsoniae]RTE11185.1 hypothetical protein EJQ19_02535 [Paenibacillus whitsoniae]